MNKKIGGKKYDNSGMYNLIIPVPKPKIAEHIIYTQ